LAGSRIYFATRKTGLGDGILGSGDISGHVHNCPLDRPFARVGGSSTPSCFAAAQLVFGIRADAYAVALLPVGLTALQQASH
jgi:hypothetical protein